MHSKNILKKFIPGMTFLAITTSAIVMGFTNDLNLYIHPRYIIFTFIFAIVGTLLYVAGKSYRDSAIKNSHSHISWVSASLCLGFVFALIIVPPKTLSSRTAMSRTSNVSNRLPQRNVSLARNTSTIKLEDWVSLLSQQSSAKLVIGKEAKVSGFVLPKGGESDRLLVARFVVTCCAVDASPIYLEARYPEWSNKVTMDDWVEVSGKFVEVDGSVVLDVDTLKEIQRPDSPYAY